MEILGILKTVVGLVPYATTLMGVLEQLHVIKAQPGIMTIIDKLSPIATGLFGAIESIRSQTEDTHPEVWAPIRDDWKFQVAKWKALPSNR